MRPARHPASARTLSRSKPNFSASSPGEVHSTPRAGAPTGCADFLVASLIGLQVDFLHAAARIECASDSEALHDLRITLRGVRSLLRPLRKWPELTALDQAAAALLRSTSALRDAQVLAEELEQRGWRTEASRRRLRVEENTRRSLRKPDAKRVLIEFERWPAAFREAHSGADAKGIRRVIRRCAKRDLEKLRKVLVQSHGSPGDWHAIRLRIKRARYLCESYAAWVKPDGKLLDELKRTQSALGDEHDLGLWCAAADKDASLRPLLNGWLVARATAQCDAYARLSTLRKRLDVRRKDSKQVLALQSVTS